MKIDREQNLLIINNQTFDIEYNNNYFLFSDDYDKFSSIEIKSQEIPQDLIMNLNCSDGFGTYLFHQVEFFKNDDDSTQIVFKCNQPNKYWEGRYGLSTLLMEIIEQTKNSIDLEPEMDTFEIENDWKYLELFTSIEGDFIISDAIETYSKKIISIVKQAELSLSGSIWKKEYEKDEKLFCTEILYPLLRKMNFLDVRFTHGTQEFGKDFTFSELTPFGNLRHYGIQVKAGNMSGNVKSDIDEILGQIEDAFSMPYFEISANEERRINTFLIAISGNFTNNAKEKIAHKIPPNLRGSVYMLDREKIRELIERYWK